MYKLVILLTFILSCSALAPTHHVYDIKGLRSTGIDAFKASLLSGGGWSYWIEVGDKLLVLSKDVDPIFIVSNAHISKVEKLAGQILLHHLGFAIINAKEEDLAWAKISLRETITPFSHQNLVLAVQSESVSIPPLASMPNPTVVPVSTLVNLVDQDRWFADVKTLATFNRYTRGPGIALAQAWIQQQLAPLTNLDVTLQPFTSGSTSGVNIIATIKGTQTPDDWVIIGGHYDSTSQSPSTSAPGAEDDGSGAAAVLEMARIYNANPPPSTLLLIFFSGEEQGLYGSAAHAQSLVNDGNAPKVKLMHNMDMIAYQQNRNGPHQVLLETAVPYVPLFPYYQRSAQQYTDLTTYQSTTAWGSDHESYIRRGMPGLLTIDYDWDIYPDYHRTTDTPDKLDPTLGYQIIKLGVGATAQVLGYPFP